MRSRECRQSRLQIVTTGVLFVLSGAAVWGGAHGWYSVRDAWAWWPLGFVFPAVHALTAAPPDRRLFAGLAWLALAAVLVAANLGYVHLRFANTVGVLFVIAGARLLYLSWQRGRRS